MRANSGLLERLEKTAAGLDGLAAVFLCAEASVKRAHKRKDP
jgi:hypothetical protein